MLFISREVNLSCAKVWRRDEGRETANGDDGKESPKDTRRADSRIEEL
jgi:hypothetical protein